MEAGFVAQRKGPLVRSCKTLLLVPLTLYALALTTKILMLKHLRSSFPTDAAYRSQQVQTACNVGMLALTALLMALLCCKRLVERTSPFAIELAVTIFMALTMSALAFSAPQTVSRLMGQDLTATYGEGWYGSDSSLILQIGIIVTGAHLGSKVRWFILLPMAVLGVLLYSANAFVVGSAEPMENVAYNMLLIGCLIIMASVAKRFAERVERRDFLDEAELRHYQAQTPGSQENEGDAQPPRMGQTLSDGSRIASEGEDSHSSGVRQMESHNTAISAHVFEPLYSRDVDPKAQLAHIAAMGEAEHWRIAESEVKLLDGETLGSGSYGVVSRAVFCGLLVAVKCPERRLDLESMRRLPGFCNELRVLRHLRHPNIVVTLGAIIEPMALKIALVLELVQGVTLDKFVLAGQAPGGSDPGTLARYQVMLGVCRALLYMHTRRPPLVHGDLKSANIMVETQDGSAHPKLLDFGLSRIISRSSRPLGGTPVWMSPEVIRKSGTVSCSADVYSFGRVLAFVATGIPPYAGLNANQVRKALLMDSPPQPAWPPECVFKPHLKQPVRSCISADPSRRPSILDLHGQLLRLPRELDLGRSGSAFLKAVRTIQAEVNPPAKDFSWEQEVPPVDAIGMGLDLDRVGAVLPEFTTPVSLGGGPQGDQPNSVPDGDALCEGANTQALETLLHPGKLPTDPGAMALSLLDLFTRWNFKVTGAQCCQLHSGARMAKQLITALLERPCFTHTPIIAGGQCMSCGMLGLEQNVPVCDFCRSEPPATGTGDVVIGRTQL